MDRLQMALSNPAASKTHCAGLEGRERRSLDEILTDARECALARSRTAAPAEAYKSQPENAVKGAKDSVYELDGAIEDELQETLNQLVERVHSANQAGRSEDEVLEEVLREDGWGCVHGPARSAMLEERMLAMAKRSHNNSRGPSRRSMETPTEVERSSSSASLPFVAPRAAPPFRRSSLVLAPSALDGLRGARYRPATLNVTHERHSQVPPDHPQAPSLLALIRQQREEQEQQQQQQQQQQHQVPRAAKWKREFGMALHLPSGNTTAGVGRDHTGWSKSSLPNTPSPVSLQHHASPTAFPTELNQLHDSPFPAKGSSPQPQRSLSPSPLALSRESSLPSTLEHATSSCPPALLNSHSNSPVGGSGSATPHGGCLPGSPLARSSLKGPGWPAGVSGGRRSVDIPEATRPRLSLLLPAVLGGSGGLDAQGSASSSPVGMHAQSHAREGQGSPMFARRSVDRVALATAQAEREGGMLGLGAAAPWGARRRMAAPLPHAEREGLGV